MLLLTDKDDAALETVLPQEGRSLGARLSAADYHNRSRAAAMNVFHSQTRSFSGNPRKVLCLLRIVADAACTAGRPRLSPSSVHDCVFTILQSAFSAV